VAQAADELENFTMRLAGAPFDVKSVCAACGARSRNQTVLFPEAAKEDDECMDRKCFNQNIRLHYQKLAKDLADKGLKVLTEAKEVQALKQGKTSCEIDPDPQAYNHPKKYKAVCASCEKRALFIIEQHHGNYDSGEICLDKKCFNAMNGKKDYSESAGPARSTRSSGASRQHAIFMRDRFLRTRVPAKVEASEILQQRLVLFNILCRFDCFGGQGRTDLKKDHHEVFKELMKEICPSWKDPRYGQDEQSLYAAVATVPAKQLPTVLEKVVLASVPHTDEKVLLQITPEAGISMEKDFVVDEQFLQTKTKAELTSLMKKFDLTGYQGNDARKKPEIIKLMLSQKLIGKMPPEVAKECKIVTFSSTKTKRE
jgi:hypothetical protein